MDTRWRYVLTREDGAFRVKLLMSVLEYMHPRVKNIVTGKI